ncbi:MAG: cobalamin-dependent protein [Deltaproteobacteria bacterium]|nr:cobalamin-dependent protein [Deltaproteobacteria bacterium]
MEQLVAALLDGDQAGAAAEARRLRQSGAGRQDIILGGIETAMARLDAKCTLEQFNLLEIMLCGRAVMGVMQELYPAGDPPPLTKGPVVVATLEGDIHDLGKNIVKMVLTAAGYRVVDCGKDCPVDQLTAVVAQEKAAAVSLSGLITSVIPQVRLVRERLTRAGLAGVRLAAGGAALRQAASDELNVDYVGQTSFDLLRFLESPPAEAS